MEYTLLKTYGNQESAYIDAGMLRTHGIKCEVQESAGSELFPAPDGGIGWTKLFVDRDQGDQALNLLKNYSD